MGDFVQKLQAFGFDTVKVNGNDIDELVPALERTRAGGERPYAIVLDTVKGAGVQEVAEKVMNHSLPVSDEQYERWTKALEAEKQAWEVEA